MITIPLRGSSKVILPRIRIVPDPEAFPTEPDLLARWMASRWILQSEVESRFAVCKSCMMKEDSDQCYAIAFAPCPKHDSKNEIMVNSCNCNCSQCGHFCQIYPNQPDPAKLSTLLWLVRQEMHPAVSKMKIASNLEQV